MKKFQFRLYSLLGLVLSLNACQTAEITSNPEALPIAQTYQGTIRDTVRIAVLPFQYTGVSEKENDLMWASGLRVLLSSFLEAHPHVRVQDRESLKATLKLAQINRFGANVDFKPMSLEGADFVVMGNYFMANTSQFANLEIRMIAVENGAVVAQTHLSNRILSANRLPDFLESFTQKTLQQLQFPLQDWHISERKPCKSQGFSPFMQALALRDRAFVAENREEAISLYEQAISRYEESRHYFCGSWIVTEIQTVQQGLNILKGGETPQ